jgi:hypothetical protein
MTSICDKWILDQRVKRREVSRDARRERGDRRNKKQKVINK